MTSLEKAAEEFVSKFNDIDIDSVGEFGTDLHMFIAGAKYEQERAKVLVEALESIELIPLGGMDFNSDKKYLMHSHKLSQDVTRKALKSYKAQLEKYKEGE